MLILARTMIMLALGVLLGAYLSSHNANAPTLILVPVPIYLDEGDLEEIEGEDDALPETREA